MHTRVLVTCLISKWKSAVGQVDIKQHPNYLPTKWYHTVDIIKLVYCLTMIHTMQTKAVVLHIQFAVTAPLFTLWMLIHI